MSSRQHSALRLPSYRSLHSLRYHPYPRLSVRRARNSHTEIVMEHEFPSQGRLYLLQSLVDVLEDRSSVIALGFVVAGMGVSITEEHRRTWSLEHMVIEFAFARQRQRVTVSRTAQLEQRQTE